MVQLISWDTKNDIFTEGQWLKGRIYNERSDLSPDGTKLIYFAGKFNSRGYTWTAVSKPPFLTALALWKKNDTWSGGGLFISDYQIAVNHDKSEMNIDTSLYKIPRYIQIRPISEYGELSRYNSTFDYQLNKDNWIVEQNLKAKYDNRKMVIEQPEIRTKVNPKNDKYKLEMHRLITNKRNGPWEVYDFYIVNNYEKISLGILDWANWCHSGDLIFAKEGCIFRLKQEKKKFKPIENAIKLIDLNNNTFQEVIPTDEALKW